MLFSQAFQPLIGIRFYGSAIHHIDYLQNYVINSRLAILIPQTKIPIMPKKEDFVRIIKQHEGVIFKITTMYTDNRDDQKDLYQDVVYQLWKSFDSFRSESKISTWMYRIALNTALTRLKKSKRMGNAVSIDRVVLEQTDNYDREFEEKLGVLYAHIKQLNVIEKGLMLLLLEGKKYEEIAEITGLSPSNVGTKISRIKQKLAKQIIKK